MMANATIDNKPQQGRVKKINVIIKSHTLSTNKMLHPEFLFYFRPGILETFFSGEPEL